MTTKNKNRFSTNWLIWRSQVMNIKGTERSGKQWNQKTDYKFLVWVSPLSFISKWLLTEQNGSELNGTERKATCFHPYLPPSLYLFLGFPFHSAPLRFVIPDNDIEILSHFISLPPSPSRSVIPVCHWNNGAGRLHDY